MKLTKIKLTFEHEDINEWYEKADDLIHKPLDIMVNGEKYRMSLESWGSGCFDGKDFVEASFLGLENKESFMVPKKYITDIMEPSECPINKDQHCTHIMMDNDICASDIPENCPLLT